MTTKVTKPRYLSGHCGTANHDACRGTYASAECRCDCHTTLLNALNDARLTVSAVTADLAQARADLAEQEFRYVVAINALHRAIDDVVYGPPSEPRRA